MSEHGTSNETVPIEIWLGDDSDLALVNADMKAWMEAHPCNCEALCTCK